MRVLAAWLGKTDLAGVEQPDPKGQGPIAQAVRALGFELILLLADDEPELKLYSEWLESWSDVKVDPVFAGIANPTDHRSIYHHVTDAVDRLIAKQPAAELTFHLSPGTPQMAAIWLLLSRTQYEAELIQSTAEHGVQSPDIPFEISAEFIPKAFEAADSFLKNAIAEVPPEGARFGDILYKSPVMAEVVHRSKKAAIRKLPVLIQGESGTGKELLARAIHNHSPWAKKPFKALNCGAIPSELVESYLFGSVPGAFTSSVDRTGYFEAADGGTLFLDEIGDLSLEAQVKLLRAIQEGQITRVGDTKEIPVDVRIIAATHKDIFSAVASGGFREDLFYRLLGVNISLPPLRNRGGDVGFLADRLLEMVNNEATSEEPNYVPKRLSAGARNVVLNHEWPGNVRELLSTLRRAAIWSESKVLSAQDLSAALLPNIAADTSNSIILDGTIDDGFRIEETLDRVAEFYLSAALDKANGNKTKAAELLGLGSYQTVTNWINRLSKAKDPRVK